MTSQDELFSEGGHSIGFSYYRMSQLMKTRHADPASTCRSGATGSSIRLQVSIEAHDRYPTWTGLALVGVPLTILVAVFGQPPLNLNLLHALGVMGPTCGMTRGVMWFARGNLTRAWAFNPASLLVLPRWSFYWSGHRMVVSQVAGSARLFRGAAGLSSLWPYWCFSSRSASS